MPFNIAPSHAINMMQAAETGKWHEGSKMGTVSKTSIDMSHNDSEGKIISHFISITQAP